MNISCHHKFPKNMKSFLYALSAIFAVSIVGCSNSDSSSTSSNCSSGFTQPAAPSVQYNLVTVGNPGNSADTTGFGSVSYSYQIGKYDVTIAQYTAFLNAVAKTDANGLYNTNMTTDLNIAGITRSGTSGSYIYSVMNNGGDSSNKPIAYVSWFNAARFSNWMSNGQPSGSQSSSTTENGAYDLSTAANGMAVPKNTCNPNTGAAVAYWIPTENEWYKAAHYSPTINNTGSPGYYLYATQSSASPGNTIGNAANQINVILGINFSVTQVATLSATQNYLTNVGAFTGSASYYGTYDQNGNLYQWNDLDGTASAYRGARGSMWFAGTQAAQSILYAGYTPSHSGLDVGFRLASF
jgi:formylglycine-generating enzyme required for sulfatase activity